MTSTTKLSWSGAVTGVQPRIRLLRSFDQVSHTYQGFVLRVTGKLAEEERAFVVGLGKSAQEKHAFRVGDIVSGLGELVDDPDAEICHVYKVSKLALVDRPRDLLRIAHPWSGAPPALEVYRARGHRRLAADRFEASCTSCIYGCEMAVEIIVDQWTPGAVRWRRETFCYGLKSCPLYKAGPKRKVPGRKGMRYTEEDWVDEGATSHRGPDD